MSHRNKIIQRVLSKPNDLRFEEMEKFLILCGYQLDRVKGSHYIYTRQSYPTLTIPRKSPLKVYLINQALQAVEEILEELMDD